MACFVVPGTEAIVVSAIAHHIKKKESAQSAQEAPAAGQASSVSTIVTSKAAKLALLANLLWGGVVLLAFEHVWHGEVAFTFPFLTAIGTDAQASMLQEMATVGVGMALTVTAVWAVAMLAVRAIAKKDAPALHAHEAQPVKVAA